MKKFSSIVAVLVAAMFMLTACSESTTKLRRACESVNEQCPISIGVAGSLDVISYDESTNTVKFHYAINEDYVSITDMAEVADDNADMILEFLRSQSTNDFLVLILEAQANIEMIYEGETTHEKYELMLEYERIKEGIGGTVAESAE